MCKGVCLMRLWTTTPTRSKRKRLSISEQPFSGVGKVFSGVYRYMYHCIQYANGLKDIRDSYSIYDKDCGLQAYLALPIFEPPNDRQPQQRRSTGVLEILTFTESISLDATFLEKLKGVGLAIRCPPPCRKPEGCRGRSDMRVVGLYPLRDLYDLTLIRLWFHCIGTLVQQLWNHNVEFGSTDDQEFSVEFSHMDDVFKAVYHKVHRTGCQVQRHELGNGKEGPKVATVQEDDVQHSQIRSRQLGEASKAAKELEDDQVQNHEVGNVKEDHKVAIVEADNVQHCQIKSGQLGEASKAIKRLKVDQVQSHKYSRSHREKQWLSLSVQKQSSETPADQKNTQWFPSSVQQLTSDEKNPQDTTEASGEPGLKIRKRKFTLDMIQNSFGRTLTDVAKELKVHKSTLKRWCRSYGIQSWPSPKRNKPNPVPRPSNELGDCGGKEQECDSRPSPDHDSREKQVTDVHGPGNFSFDHHHSLIVKARYNECLVKFPFPTNSGIEALLRSLGMRFKLEVGRIRIEYEDEDGDKVMISCDEDLRYHMHNLSSSGRTRMDLSVLLAV